MDCIDSFRMFFLTFNLMWKKVRTFEVLCIDLIKEIFIWVSLIFCVRKIFLVKGVIYKFSKLIWFVGIAKSSLHDKLKEHVELSTKRSCYK